MNNLGLDISMAREDVFKAKVQMRNHREICRYEIHLAIKKFIHDTGFIPIIKVDDLGGMSHDLFEKDNPAYIRIECIL